MTERDLHDALHHAVADVEPTRDLDEVRERAGRPRARQLPVLVAAALATVLALAGSAWLVQHDGTEATPAATPDPRAEARVTAYAVVETPVGPRLVPDRREVAADDGLLVTAVRETLLEPASQPGGSAVWLDGGPDWLADVGASVDGDVVTVDIEPGRVVDLRTTPADTPLLAQAVAWTAAAALEDAEIEVRFTRDGRPEPGFLPSGSVVPDPSVLAPVTLESVLDGDTVSAPFVVSGLAEAFEGTVTWRLLDGEQVVREGFTTAEECCTMSPFAFQLDAPPGDYVLEVAETDPSDGEGVAPYVARVRLTVE